MNFEKEWQKEFSQSALKGGQDYQISHWAEQGLVYDIEYFLRYLAGLNRGSTFAARALDVGCGPGTYTEILAKKGWLVFAVDYAPEMIQRAKEKCSPWPVVFLTANVYRLPFQDNFFDLIIALGLFQHLTEPQKALKEINRVLKQGGLLMLSTLNKFSLARPFLQRDPNLPLVKRYFPYQFKKMLKPAGFSQSQLKGVYFTPFSGLNQLVLRARLYRFFNLFFPLFFSLAHHFILLAEKDNS